MDLSELMSSVSKAMASLPLVVDHTSSTSSASSNSTAAASTTGKALSIPFFPQKPATPYEFDMRTTTHHLVKKLTKFGDIVKENPDVYELESRLIVKLSNSHKISPSVPTFLFDKILNFFTLNARHYKFVPWYYTIDHFYQDDLRMRRTWPKSSRSSKYRN